MRVLVIKPDHLGDFALALPSLWEVRERLGKDAEIDVLASEQNVEWSKILDWLPNIEPIQHPRYSRPQEPPLPLLQSLFARSLSLRKRQYDYGIELSSTSNDWVGKAMLALAGTKQRCGGEGSFDFLLHEKQETGGGHESRRLSRRFPKEWGITGFASPEKFMPPHFRNPGNQGRILLVPWAGTDAKQWPLENWREVTLALKGQDVAVLSPPHTDVRAKAICEDSGASVLSTQSITETLDILTHSHVAVTLDSATAHFSWLTGTPVVELFAGTTEFGRWGSLAGGNFLLKHPPCVPCHLENCPWARHHCMLDITVDEVISSIRQITSS